MTVARIPRTAHAAVARVRAVGVRAVAVRAQAAVGAVGEHLAVSGPRGRAAILEVARVHVEAAIDVADDLSLPVQALVPDGPQVAHVALHDPGRVVVAQRGLGRVVKRGDRRSGADAGLACAAHQQAQDAVVVPRGAQLEALRDRRGLGGGEVRVLPEVDLREQRCRIAAGRVLEGTGPELRRDLPLRGQRPLPAQSRQRLDRVDDRGVGSAHDESALRQEAQGARAERLEARSGRRVRHRAQLHDAQGGGLRAVDVRGRALGLDERIDVADLQPQQGRRRVACEGWKAKQKRDIEKDKESLRRSASHGMPLVSSAWAALGGMPELTPIGGL